MSKHTPGPWTVYIPQADSSRVVIKDSKNKTFLDLGGWGSDKNQDICDANLIAAAPDMLEVLEEFILQMEAGILPLIPCRKAKEIIAKLKGGPT